MAEFTDILYGRIDIPDWLLPFVRLPEFVRLRGVRLSNVDSFQFKDFNGPSRWEHGIGVAGLALRCADRRMLSEVERVQLALAALLHDVATPPFAHTAEYVLDNFDHELETQRILSAVPSLDSSPGTPIFGSQLPQFRRECASLSRKLGVKIDPDEVARMVTGEGDLGFLITGSIDLDNADNVTRACLYLGIEVDRSVPIRVAEWLATQERMPTELSRIAEPAVRAWLSYRDDLYGAFFSSSEQELGRQAFLQHLMRRALRSGLPRRTLVWNTDEGLLHTIAEIHETDEPDSHPTLRELVQRYRLLEETYTVATVSIQDEEELRALRLPHAATWIEGHLTSADLEVFVIVLSRRHTPGEGQVSLFPPAAGALLVFKLGEVAPKVRQLPQWLREEIQNRFRSAPLKRGITDALRRKIPLWIAERPWLQLDGRRRESVIENLQSNGDWSFRLSRNESLHAYPGTYVHALPATIINCLGLKGELILDPFGGTGQTAVEAIKAGGSAITSDSNTIATLVTRAKLTYLSPEARQYLSTLSSKQIRECEPVPPPEFELREKWHHPHTLVELTRILSFINSCNDCVTAQFLRASFSATIPEATGRKGKQHGYFADNTPLASGQEAPPYQDAISLFLARVSRNIAILERFYAAIERDDRDPSAELKRVSVLQLDARTLEANQLGVGPHSIPAIVTSPPYLCMADYALGQRLSYYWLEPEGLNVDFGRELGPRRQRFQPKIAPDEYFEGLGQFAEKAARLLRPGGFLATVIGAPEAKAFKDIHVLRRVDAIWERHGFRLLWSDWRPIQWHRNHGYQRLRRERVAVHVFGDT